MWRVMGLNVSLLPPNSRVELFTPRTQNVTLFGDRVFVGNQVKVKSLGWFLTQYDLRPCKKGEFGHRDLCRGKTMRKQGEGSH